MRLVHSISMTLLVSAVASLSACSSDPEEDPAGTGGAAGSGTGGSATGGAAGSATGGSAGSATGGSAGTATGGSAGSGMSGSGGTGVMDFPADATQMGIQTFLDGNSYTTAPWKPETMAGNPAAIPHLATRRYFNGTLIASKAAGNNPPGGTQHVSGSMAVKELLEGTTVVGKAAMLRTNTNWAYYCMSSVADRCYTGYVANTPYYSGTTGSCACHGSGAMPSFDAIPAP